MPRNVATRKIRDRVLVVCEGATTEPNYFEKFPKADVAKIDVVGAGANTDSLVELAIELMRDAIGRGEPYNEVWCVFDRDSFSAQQFNRALQLAGHHIHVAVSNQCFELWYLLHFCYLDTGVRRKDYIKKLSKHLRVLYRKNSTAMYDTLLDKQAAAIRNAERLLECYCPHNPEKADPSTTVHKLVRRLNELAS
jgi:hypothetical protein